MSFTHNVTPGQLGSGNVAESSSQAVPNRLLTTKEAARFLGVSSAFLERDRWAGARIPFVRVGSRAVRYAMAELQAFIAGHTRTNTTDLGGAP